MAVSRNREAFVTLRRKLVTILLIGLTLLVHTPATSQAITWTGPTAATNTTGLHYSPSVTQDNQGNVFLFWDQSPGIFYMKTNTTAIHNNQWPSPVAFGSGQDVSPAALALKNGTMILFWNRCGAPTACQTNSNWDIYTARYNNGIWSPSTPLITNLAPDQNPTALQDSSGNIRLAWTRNEAGDLNLRFVDSNNNSIWDPTEPIIYDSDGNTFYNTGRYHNDTLVSGAAPANNTSTKVDSGVKFIDSNGNNIWNTGEFVSYDPNLNGAYDPKITYKDSNNDYAWEPGETIAYDANADGMYTSHIGVTNCATSTPLGYDCIISGSVPGNQTALKIDSHLKFLDLNGNRYWDPGETLVYDTNNNYQYDPGEPVTALLANDIQGKLKFVGNGTSWVTGNMVVYDSNGNGVYDAKIRYVDSNFNLRWDPGETVVYDSNLDGLYQFGEPVITGIAPASGTPLRGDNKLEFLDSNSNGARDDGEAVIYDTNLNRVFDGKIGFVDSNSNGVWNLGESIVLDNNLNGKYDPGETVISGSIPASGTTLREDPKLRFTDPNDNLAWDAGESVIYDSNSNNIYDSGETIAAGPTPALNTGVTTGIGDLVVVGASPPISTGLSIDSRIKYVDSDGSGSWNLPDPFAGDSGETVVYDLNNTGTFGTGDPIIYQGATLPAPGAALSIDSRMRFVDANSNGVWNGAEAVVYDSNLNNIYDTFELTIRGTMPGELAALAANPGEALVGCGPASCIPPSPGAILKTDAKIRLLDLNGNTLWDIGEPVEYDTNTNGVFDMGDVVIGANPTPVPGTPLKSDELIISGIAFSSPSALASDPHLKFIDSNSDFAWSLGETVVYDSDGNNQYTTGKFNNNTIVVGAPPANGTALATDSRVKYYDSNANGHWDPGETVLYDSNNNGIYDPGEPIIAVFTAPSSTTTVSTDSKLKYWETGGDNHWDPGESVVYDTNGNGSFDPGTDWTISGATPIPTSLSSDSHIKFANSNGGSVWDRGEAVVYDSNNNGKYDAGEPIMQSGTPLVGSPLKTALHIFYTVYNGLSWSQEQRLTSLPYSDHVPSLAQTDNGKFWTVWAGDPRTVQPGPTQILYKTSTDGANWSPEGILDSNVNSDNDPSIQQDRNGTIWVAWTRTLTNGCNALNNIQEDLYYSSSANNGASWVSPQAWTSTTCEDEFGPHLAQLNDKQFYNFFIGLTCTSGQSGTCTGNIDYFTSNPLIVHDVDMNKLTTSLSAIRAGQTLILTANVTNTGDFNDTVTVTFRANGTLVATNASLIRIGTTNLLTVKWLTTGIAPGRYTITANATAVGETYGNLGNNAASLSSTLLISLAGDVNLDCKVNIIDLATVGSAFGTSQGTPGYKPQADLNGDGTVNIIDLSIVGSTFGLSC